jgi:asparagine synthase (glutamine-hydrolysing)
MDGHIFHGDASSKLRLGLIQTKTMCGISGFVDLGHVPTTDATAVLQRMNRRLTHRGPDAEGYQSIANVHLGHRRLSVIDIAASTQPMTTADGRHTIVYNGEIYNYRELRQELIAEGRHFRTGGDTEVLLQAIAAWGDHALSRVRGMFAFACLDRLEHSLLLARDHIGVKPLHIAVTSDFFGFASELKALTEHPAVSRELNLDALGLFLECQYIPAPHTIYRDIRKLDPAHAIRLDVRTGQTRVWKYWQASFASKVSLTDKEAVQALDQALRQSVESMLVADVPLGAFVSGGVDSSVVAAMMTELTRQPVETFNLGFLDDQGRPDATQSEHDEAARVAQHLGSHHHPLMVRPSDVTEAFEEWVNVFDEPFGDQAALPTLLLSRLTRQHVTVALSGEGADELFAGYANYQKRAREETISGLLGASLSPLPVLLKHAPAAVRRDRLVKAIVAPKRERYSTIPNVFDRATHPSLLSAAMLAQEKTRVAQYAARFFDESDAPDYIERIMQVDFRLWLPDDLLTKVDRATMAYSLEARVPYLDHRFVETVATLPSHLKQRGKTTKWILKTLAEKYLPHDIVHRNKQGFVMPLTQWLAGGLKPAVQMALGDCGLSSRGIFKVDALKQLRTEHESGRRNHAGRIWALTVLEQWFQRYQPSFRL